MPIPEFVAELRAHVGTMPLWLSGSTAVIVRDAPGGGEVLLVQRADTGEWSPVCGIVDPGEEPGDAAVRESEEEASVVVEVDRLVWMYVTAPVTYPNGDVTQYIDHTFRCRWVSGDPHPADGENLEARWFPVDALPPLEGEFAERVAVALADEPECRLGQLSPADRARLGL
jgi:8-oxo-dGTP pyrophosphatase MutT (NUDIX family)